MLHADGITVAMNKLPAVGMEGFNSISFAKTKSCDVSFWIVLSNLITSFC